MSGQEHDPEATRQSESTPEASRYRIEKALGSGGMGDVHLAEDARLQRKVAIKSIRTELSQDPEVRKRLERESLLHAKIGAHPHIVTLYDQYEEEGRIHLVLEYVDGDSLHDLVDVHAKEGTRMPWRDGVRLVCQVLDALGRIHAQGMVHRDIKPSNILVTRNEDGALQAKLMDFGIARMREEDQMTALTREGGSGPGTPLYMAPEQIDPQTFGELSPATDVYATGIMLYQILAGEPPFKGSLTEIFNGHLNAAPAPFDNPDDPAIPAAFMTVLSRALKKHSDERYVTAKAFREALEDAASAVGKAPEPDDFPGPANLTDPNQTVTAAEAAQASAEAVSGQTLLDTTGAGKPQRRGKGGVAGGIVAAVVALLLLAGAAAGGYWWFNRGGGGAGQEGGEAAAADSASTQSADAAHQQDGSASASAAEASPSGGMTQPASVSDIGPVPSTGVDLDDSQPSADRDQGSGVSAMDALLQGLPEDTEPVAEPEPVAASAPEPEPDPEPVPEPVRQPRPAAQPKPKPKPAPQPEPEPEPAVREPEPEPKPSSGGWNVIRKEDKKIE